ncbi:hypothetical protein DFA_01317 [Cavenderia fasciculata]|uniref:Transmembrane protein n=1 Tax=Cavenderia fasciculata TaxID=261658 RepID=F4PS50_CACFS|nr:uncharacterized protein DFA_01317 [Cavenderia fasciculata]EGG21433.1 hypothetical protein DFA_01317 [Cavenderia fasciculata]|eukprot:XP_004359283.1 hypothetical protein DFA_01317 [Cavenderia fasciculata]
MSTSPWYKYVIAFFTPVAVGTGITWILMRDGDKDLSQFKQEQPETLKLYHENNVKIMKRIVDSTKGDKIVYFAEKEVEVLPSVSDSTTKNNNSVDAQKGFLSRWFGWGSSSTDTLKQDKPLKQSDAVVTSAPTMVPTKQQANQQKQEDRIKQLQEETKKKQQQQQQK